MGKALAKKVRGLILTSVLRKYSSVSFVSREVTLGGAAFVKLRCQAAFLS